TPYIVFHRCIRPKANFLVTNTTFKTLKGSTASFSQKSTPSSEDSSSRLYNKLLNNKNLRKYANQFRTKPTSHIVSFLILHELTAIIPIPIIYVFLSTTGIEIPFSQSVLDEGNEFINRVVVYYGYEPFENGSRVALNLVTSYAIVKFLLPVRIAICIWLTPWTAERIISPATGLVRRFVKTK
ncbi:5456_t:CDS:2, partial [Acaulospora morrowiae]